MFVSAGHSSCLALQTRQQRAATRRLAVVAHAAAADDGGEGGGWSNRTYKETSGVKNGRGSGSGGVFGALGRFLFNLLCWSVDCVVWVLETLVESVSLLLNFGLTSATGAARSMQRVLQGGTWQTPTVKSQYKGSYIMRGLRMLLTMVAQIVGFACLLRFFPEVRAGFASVGLFLSAPLVTVIATMCACVLLLPQQQLFRDPVTRVFFRRGWFGNYGRASFFAKCVSFLVVSVLFCSIWVL